MRGGRRAIRIQSVERRQGLQTVHQKFQVENRPVEFLTSTMKQQSLLAYLMHVSQGSQIYILKLFFYLSTSVCRVGLHTCHCVSPQRPQVF